MDPWATIGHVSLCRDVMFTPTNNDGDCCNHFVRCNHRKDAALSVENTADSSPGGRHYFGRQQKWKGGGFPECQQRFPTSARSGRLLPLSHSGVPAIESDHAVPLASLCTVWPLLPCYGRPRRTGKDSRRKLSRNPRLPVAPSLIGPRPRDCFRLVPRRWLRAT